MIDLYVINLDRAPERWNELQHNFQAFPSYQLRRFPAVDGKTFTPTQIKELVTPRAFYVLHRKFRLCHEDFTTVGAIGCFLSHLQLWKECVQQNKPLFIVEDDFRMNSSMDPLFQEAQTLIPQLGFMLLKLNSLRGNSTLPYNSMWDSFQGLFFGTMVYCLTPFIAQQLIQHALPINCQVDSYIGHMSVRNNFRIYISHERTSIWDMKSSSVQNFWDCATCWNPAFGYGNSKTSNQILLYIPYVELAIILGLLLLCFLH